MKGSAMILIATAAYAAFTGFIWSLCRAAAMGDAR